MFLKRLHKIIYTLEEVGGQLEVINDLEMNSANGNSVEVQYNVPAAELDYWQNLVNDLFNGNE